MLAFRHVALCGAAILAQLGVAGFAAAQETVNEDLLTLARGAVLVSATVDPVRALALIDGDAESNWNSSTKKNPPPYDFVFELMAPSRISRVGIDGSGERPGGVAGGSAGWIVVEGSSQGPDTGFSELARFQAGPDGPTLADVEADAPARWLRYRVLGGQSDGVSWVYLDEAIAHGEQAPVEEEGRYEGIFKTGRADFAELHQDGLSLAGCYSDNGGKSWGTLSGAVRDGVAFLNWTSDTKITGTAVLTIDSSGALAGVRYRQRSRSPWGGPTAPGGTTTPCNSPIAANPVAAGLAEDGKVRLYGIYFDHDSDTLKPSAEPALRQLHEALSAGTGLNVAIEGHTDSAGADDYNLSLSQRRAAAVVRWLTDQGIDASRLTPLGKGETDPVATNATADGRALNRRVEVAVR